MPASARTLANRLRWYWQMEAVNAAIVPASAMGLLSWADGGATIPFLVAAVACSALLVIGALYWRAVLRQVEGDSGAFDYWLPRLAAAQPLSLALIAAAAVLIVAEVMVSGEGWSAAIIGGAVLTMLAALEYVNYYLVQLQHFDNWADFKRLTSGRGFRRAHLARDIRAWRYRTRESRSR